MSALSNKGENFSPDPAKIIFSSARSFLASAFDTFATPFTSFTKINNLEGRPTTFPFPPKETVFILEETISPLPGATKVEEVVTPFHNLDTPLSETTTCLAPYNSEEEEPYPLPLPAASKTKETYVWRGRERKEREGEKEGKGRGEEKNIKNYKNFQKRKSTTYLTRLRHTSITLHKIKIPLTLCQKEVRQNILNLIISCSSTKLNFSFFQVNSRRRSFSQSLSAINSQRMLETIRILSRKTNKVVVEKQRSIGIVGNNTNSGSKFVRRPNRSIVHKNVGQTGEVHTKLTKALTVLVRAHSLSQTSILRKHRQLLFFLFDNCGLLRSKRRFREMLKPTREKVQISIPLRSNGHVGQSPVKIVRVPQTLIRQNPKVRVSIFRSLPSLPVGNTTMVIQTRSPASVLPSTTGPSHQLQTCPQCP